LQAVQNGGKPNTKFPWEVGIRLPLYVYALAIRMIVMILPQYIPIEFDKLMGKILSLERGV